jgi:hypothetical protein
MFGELSVWLEATIEHEFPFWGVYKYKYMFLFNKNFNFKFFSKAFAWIRIRIWQNPESGFSKIP